MLSLNRTGLAAIRHIFPIVTLSLALLFTWGVAPVHAQQAAIPDDVLNIFTNNCATSGCHTQATAKMDLVLERDAAFAHLVKRESQQVPEFLLVQPGDPDNSYLLKKIEEAPEIKGKQMPRGAEPLSVAQIAAIRAWIASLPENIEKQEHKPAYKKAFPDWSTTNLPTTQTLAPRSFLFRISHRFRQEVSEGFSELFGLDGGAFMLIGLALPVTENISFATWRQRINQTFEFGLKWRFLRETTDGAMPLSAAIYAGVDWATEGDIPNPAGDDKLSLGAGERFSWFAQVPLSKQFGKHVSVLLVPGILLNGNITRTDEDPLVTLGFTGNYRFNKAFGIYLEGIPILAGATTALPVVGVPIQNSTIYDTFSAGLEIIAGAHTFHVFIANSIGNTTNQYMSGGELDLTRGEMRLGFNIFRTIDF